MGYVHVYKKEQQKKKERREWRERKGTEREGRKTSSEKRPKKLSLRFELQFLHLFSRPSPFFSSVSSHIISLHYSCVVIHHCTVEDSKQEEKSNILPLEQSYTNHLICCRCLLICRHDGSCRVFLSHVRAAVAHILLASNQQRSAAYSPLPCCSLSAFFNSSFSVSSAAIFAKRFALLSPKASTLSAAKETAQTERRKMEKKKRDERQYGILIVSCFRVGSQR